VKRASLPGSRRVWPVKAFRGQFSALELEAIAEARALDPAVGVDTTDLPNLKAFRRWMAETRSPDTSPQWAHLDPD
jgi:hypothetical protein